MSDEKTPRPAAQEAEAERAMKLKSGAKTEERPSSGQTADEGMNPSPDATVAPSGAFGAEGQRPVLERSHKVR